MAGPKSGDIGSAGMRAKRRDGQEKNMAAAWLSPLGWCWYRAVAAKTNAGGDTRW